MSAHSLLQRVRIRNFKSIGSCDVELRQLTFLVGRNGSGKTNFLDALRFVANALLTSLDHALVSRGGVDAVRRRSAPWGRGEFAIELALSLHPGPDKAVYQFEIGFEKNGGFFVKSEKLEVRPDPTGDVIYGFHVSKGTVIAASRDTMPPAAKDRLYLVTAAALPEFRMVYDGLTEMRFYTLDPQQMREVQSPDAGELLRENGSNIASVVGRMAHLRPDVKRRIGEYLTSVVPDVVDFSRVPVAHRETLEFVQQVDGFNRPWSFYSSSMSDGTLRCLGILVAAMQFVDHQTRVQLVGIEEPETALHPAAAGALMDSLREASAETQIIITTQSPDLIDQFNSAEDSLLVVQMQKGTTVIGPADHASTEAIRNHLYTPGELLRLDQLQPDRESRRRQTEVVIE